MQNPGTESSPGPDASPVGALRDDHEALRELCARIAAAADAASLTVALDRLLSQLETHFAREEAPGGLLAALGDRAAERRDRILEEHGAILATLQDLLQRLHADPDLSLQPIDAEVSALVRRLEQHDASEISLIEEFAGAQASAEASRGVRTTGDPLPIDSALEVNLRRTAVEVQIPAAQQVLLEITADLTGVQENTRKLLHEINHPFVGWPEALEDLHRRAMNDLRHYMSLARAADAMPVFWSLYLRAAKEAEPPSLRDVAIRNGLQYLEKVVREDRDSALLEAVAQALAEARDIFTSAPQLQVVASARLRRLGETLADVAPESEATAQGLSLLRETLARVYRGWLELDDPVSWWRDHTGSPVDAAPPEAIASISHESLRGFLARAEAAAADPSAAADLLRLPDNARIERAYLEAANAFGATLGASWEGRLERIRWLIRVLAVGDLSAVHERAISDITHSVLEVIRGAEREPLERFVREIFGCLRASNLGSSPSALNLVSKIGLELLEGGDAEWAHVICEELLASDFPQPEFSGYTNEWQVRVNPSHLRAIRTYLSLIESAPRMTRPLLAALVVHLRIGGVFISDTDLFQKDVSKLLNSDVGPVYHQIKRLLKLFPVYFSDIGAEGELREVSSRIDEIFGRKDPLCHFLRKQCHVESNPRMVGFTEAVAHFWATGERAPLRPYLPPSLYEHIDIESEVYRGLHRIFKSLVGGGPVAALFDLDEDILVRRLARFSDAQAIDREKALLLVKLRKLIAAKYELDHHDLLDRLAGFHRIDSDQVESLREALAQEHHETALDVLLTILEGLKKGIISGEPTEGVEDIYRKRHIAVGIPSIYGRYREEKFEAMGLSLRVESMADALFARTVASHNLEYVTRSALRRVATWLRLLLRALRSDGCSGRGLSTGTAMLEQALTAEGISVDQYINIFQFISRSVEQLIRIRFLDVYEGVARRIVGQMLERGQLETESELDDQENVLKVSEGFLRDLIAESFGLQQLDNLVGQVLRTLVSGREKLARPTLNLLMTYDAERAFSSIDGRENRRDGAIYLGNKGYMIKRVAHEGLPVPPGFILTTEVFRCRQAILECEELRAEVVDEVRRQVARLEALTGSRFGDPARPLLLSVRSGAAISMPGVLDTFLNVGINEAVAEAFASRPGSAWAAWDAYRRFVQFWGMGHGLARSLFDALMRESKQHAGVAKKSNIPAEKMRDVALRYRDFVLDHGVRVAEDPFEQLHSCVDLVLQSWHSDKAQAYRRAMRVAQEWGTAVIVQKMVYGNLSERSGTGVVLTTDPRRATGDVRLYGDYIVQGQGDDVVSGLVETHPIAEEQRLAEGQTSQHSLERDFPHIYGALLGHGRLLVNDLGMFHQELEFTFESDDPDDLYILQTRDTVLAPVTTVPAFLVSDELEQAKVGTGIGAGGGALSGRVAHTAEDIARIREAHPEDPILLLRPDTVPDDIPLILQADGMLTAVGGATSHAALVAQRLGQTCVVGCRQLQVFEAEGRSELFGRTVTTGDFLSINGIDGSVYLGQHASTSVRRQRLV